MIFFVIIFVVAIAIAFYVYYLSHGNYSEQTPSEQQPATNQPRHFDLLDDNGDPIGASDAPVQVLQYFYVKNKGYHVSVWPKDYSQFDIVEFNIAGMSHRDNMDVYLGGFKGTLEAEPDNSYDPNAIKVLAVDGHHVGYVPKDMTADVRKYATLPCPCFCYIGENDGTYFSDCYITIRE